MKNKLLGFISLMALFVCGCSCSKINENTYSNAVNIFKNTDAISFSRIEIVQKEGESVYTRKRSDASYIFDIDGHVSKMSFEATYSQGGSGGASGSSQTLKYYYSDERRTFYTYSKQGESQLERYKESNVSYDDKININVCQDNACQLMIVGNFAPIYALNEVSDFNIEDENGIGKATFKAICPSFESCESASQVIDYTLTINNNGNIDSLNYEIVNGDTKYTITYSFNKYGSDVKVTFPSDLESYNEK